MTMGSKGEYPSSLAVVVAVDHQLFFSFSGLLVSLSLLLLLLAYSKSFISGVFYLRKGGLVEKQLSKWTFQGMLFNDAIRLHRHSFN